MTIDLLTDPRFAVARAAFEKACYHSREHSALAAEALKEYGDHGPDISAIVRGHFPEYVKAKLRFHARACTDCQRRAHSWRPKRARHATMVKLGRAVAARDGSGFYGPRP